MSIARNLDVANRLTVSLELAGQLLGATVEQVERLVRNGTLRQWPRGGLLDADLVLHLARRMAPA